MFEAKDILPLLGIPGTKIKSLDTVYDGDESTIYVELEDIRGCCPECGYAREPQSRCRREHPR